MNAQELYEELVNKACRNPFNKDFVSPEGKYSEPFKKDCVKIAHEHYENNRMSSTDFVMFVNFILRDSTEQVQ